ncbi:MAG: CRISPR-associated endonuclease Cas1 [Deltaproteobacteria bacterium]|nr:CRISPR-associated endonuclease Cas1 [Deltaproteobacteria bacterium]
MSVMYIIDQGAHLTKRGNRLVVEKMGNPIQEVHAFKVDQVVLMGNIQITAPTIAFLLQEGIDTVFLSFYGKYRGRLVARFGKNILLRKAQFDRMGDHRFSLGLAKRYVAGRLQNQRVLLRRHNNELKDEVIRSAIHNIRMMLERIESQESFDALRGVEGKGTASFFRGFRRAVRVEDMPFKERSRRPPRDPVNVLLSFGYTLLANVVQTAVDVVGFDPFMGCLHAVDYGRPSLVLDLMEEFRPVLIDSLVLRVINRGVITSKDFIRQQDVEPPPPGVELESPSMEDYPILLSHVGMKKFIAQFESRLREKVFYLPTERRIRFREVVLEQARLLARHVRGEEAYEPYRMR